MNTSLLIVVPTLNSYKLLPRLIRSLQEQTWSHWRLLFIDGPSVPKHRRWLINCCSLDKRCSWVAQTPSCPGIFGAMNQAFALASPQDWLLFWGSDDWASSPNSLAHAINAIESSGKRPDLLVCYGRYASSTSAAFGRFARFHSAGVLNTSAYRRSLWYGSSPPHQSTFFGPGALARLSQYAAGFRLSADLDYFLQLSRYSDLLILCLELELVYMADSGISGQQTKRRLQEVRRAYLRTYGWFWWFPFLARYIRRLVSIIPTIN